MKKKRSRIMLMYTTMTLAVVPGAFRTKTRLVTPTIHTLATVKPSKMAQEAMQVVMTSILINSTARATITMAE